MYRIFTTGIFIILCSTFVPTESQSQSKIVKNVTECVQILDRINGSSSAKFRNNCDRKIYISYCFKDTNRGIAECGNSSIYYDHGVLVNPLSAQPFYDFGGTVELAACFFDEGAPPYPKVTGSDGNFICEANG